MNSIHPQLDDFSHRTAHTLYDTMDAARPGQLSDFIAEAYGPTIASDRAQLLGALMCDATEMALVPASVAERHIREQLDVADQDVAVSALYGVLARAEHHARSIIEVANGEPIHRSVAAAYYIASRAHSGMKPRESGEDYIEHPTEAAAMGLAILTQLESEGYEIRDSLKRKLVSLTLMHDAIEHTIRSCRYYNPTLHPELTPLAVMRTLQIAGESAQASQEVVTSLGFMTHHKHGQWKWLPDYEEYTAIGLSDYLTNLSKPLDIYHNLVIDPKPDSVDPTKNARRDRKNEQYAGALSMYRDHFLLRPDAPPWAQRYFEVLFRIKPHDIPAMRTELFHYIGIKAPPTRKARLT